MKSKRFIFLALSVLILLFCASCSRGEPPEPNRATLDQSRTHFAAFQKDIGQILDTHSVAYAVEATSSDDMPGAKPDAYSLTLRYELKTPGKETFSVTLFNTERTERFIAVLQADRASVSDCDFTIGRYPFLLDVFNLLSDTSTSKFECNRLMRSTRRGAAALYERQGEAFYTYKFKYLFKGDEDRYLSYDIQYQNSKQPGYFTETLTFEGYLSARKADNTGN